MTTVEEAYIQDLLRARRRGGDLEVLRRLNNMLADLLLNLPDNTLLDKLKRDLHRRFLREARS